MDVPPVIVLYMPPPSKFAYGFHHCVPMKDKLIEDGYFIVKDLKYTAAEHDTFIDTFETYFKVGVTPEITTQIHPTNSDGPHPKFRYNWKIAGPPANTTYKELIADPVLPEGVSDLKETMVTCANKMLATVHEIAEKTAAAFMIEEKTAAGLTIPKFDAFTSKIKLGPHVLSLTGIDLEKYGEEGTVIEASHYDHNFLTIHDSNIFSGYNIWLRNGEKIEVDIPRGCFLITAGKQMEWLTGGNILACKYEVIVTNKTMLAINEAKELGHSLWRASSTLYAHLAPDELMMPLESFKKYSRRAKEYPPIYARDAQRLVKPIPIECNDNFYLL
ncbi:hypothetical protein TSUD_360860 [Trifolium subterraneum]|uniref:Isopenicillin N synthase-like Fe(2+) 2OG dioxygenase domain-containing protein n=1 Tax=Trifolium subterraneum TaxID=3900 RepID=A0A2Z6MDP0_TRISU|nr:hypothetical protein TSUD_360860 [Trifolium subterraneum]